MVECEWQRRESQALTLPVTNVLSFGELEFSATNPLSLEPKTRLENQVFFFPGLTVSDATIASSGLLHTIRLQHFHQVMFDPTHICCFYNSILNVCNRPTRLKVYQALKITVTSQCKAHKGTFVYGCKIGCCQHEMMVVVVRPQTDSRMCTS